MLLGALAVALRARTGGVSRLTICGGLDVLLHALEFVCIVLIVGIYWRGRSPGPHGGGQIPVDPGRVLKSAMARALARVPRAGRALPLRRAVASPRGRGREELRRARPARSPREPRMGAALLRVAVPGQARWPHRDAGTDQPQRYVARLRQVMHEQKTYHEGNAAECEAITRRLHWAERALLRRAPSSPVCWPSVGWNARLGAAARGGPAGARRLRPRASWPPVSTSSWASRRRPPRMRSAG